MVPDLKTLLHKLIINNILFSVKEAIKKLIFRVKIFI